MNSYYTIVIRLLTLESKQKKKNNKITVGREKNWSKPRFSYRTIRDSLLSPRHVLITRRRRRRCVISYQLRHRHFSSLRPSDIRPVSTFDFPSFASAARRERPRSSPSASGHADACTTVVDSWTVNADDAMSAINLRNVKRDFSQLNYRPDVCRPELIDELKNVSEAAGKCARKIARQRSLRQSFSRSRTRTRRCPVSRRRRSPRAHRRHQTRNDDCLGRRRVVFNGVFCFLPV